MSDEKMDMVTVAADTKMHLADVLHVLIRRRASFWASPFNAIGSEGMWQVRFRDPNQGHLAALKQRGYVR